MKRHDRHNKTLCTTGFCNSVLGLVYILFIHKSSSIFHTEQSYDRPKFDTYTAQKNKQTNKHPNKQTNKQKQNKKKRIQVRSSNLSQALRHKFFFFQPYVSLVYLIIHLLSFFHFHLHYFMYLFTYQTFEVIDKNLILGEFVNIINLFTGVAL